MGRVLKRSLAALGVVVLSLGLVELGAMALVRAGVVDAPRPHRGRSGVWWHGHPDFGAWHKPGSEGDQWGTCYKARYRINSVGARDVERPRRVSGPRVVVLGDSFLEGFGVEADSRLSEMLEAATGVPHLNFAMASFGPYQQLLVYEKLAREFDHTAVLVSVFPGNDFDDMDYEDCLGIGDPDYCWRPYPGPPPGLARVDRFEPAWRWHLKAQSQAFMALLAAQRGRQQAARVAPRSLFYEFREDQAALLEAVLERFRAAAAGKELVVLLIPKQGDLEAFAELGPDPLSARLAAWAAPRGVRVVSLVAGMAIPGRDWSAYYLPCDFHWSRWGNRVASQLVLEALADLYPPKAATPRS